jgi:uncharacterized protein (UPF0332 family)
VSSDLITTARKLAQASAKKPKQSDLKRAVSTAYYALFHALAQDNADLLVGKAGPNRPKKAWNQVYRALSHAAAKTACDQLRALNFPAEIVACGDAFIARQQARHDADYDPDHRITRADALSSVDLAEEAIGGLRACGRKDRLAFAVHVLFRKRWPSLRVPGGRISC